jgi:ubiquinone/menaquinone biosynthesis C-methylase UbiE
VERDVRGEARRWFDRRARGYETGATSRWRDPVQRGTLEALELGPTDRVLDVGCGTGAASRTAAGTAASVVGVDLAPKMIRQARSLAGDEPNLRFEVADAERLPFDDGSFSAVLCSNSLHHHPDPPRSLAEMARVLAPGGRVAVGDACSDLRAARIADWFLRRFEPGHVRLYRSAELAAFVRGAGFVDGQLRMLVDGGFAIVRGRKPEATPPEAGSD